MMLLRCFSKTLQCNTGVLQIYPPKRKSRPEIYVPSVRKRQGNIFGATLTIRPREEMGVMLC